MDTDYLKACSLIDQNKLAEALELLIRIMPQLTDRHMIFNKIGVIYAKQGNHQEAIRYFNSALSLKPDYAPGIVNLGSAYLEQGDDENALRCYAEAIGIAPDYYLAYYNMAILCKKQGDYDAYMDNIKKYKRLYAKLLRDEDRTKHTTLKDKLSLSQITAGLIEALKRGNSIFSRGGIRETKN